MMKHILSHMSAVLFLAGLLASPAPADPDSPAPLAISLPDTVGSLVAGKSNYADVVRLLGDPELLENVRTKGTREDLLEMRYPRKGIEFTIDKNKQMRVARIEVYRPFAGSSPEGIHLGMPIADARKVVSSRHGNPNTEFEGYVDWQIPNTFALKHEDGVVIAIKMLGK